MIALNEVKLIGNLGKDPESRQFNNGRTMTSFSLATSESWKDKQTGELKSSTQWHSVVFFGPAAETLARVAKKGDKLYVSGKLTYRTFEGNDGQTKYVTEVVGADYVTFGNGGGGTESNGHAEPVSTDNGKDEMPF